MRFARVEADGIIDTIVTSNSPCQRMITFTIVMLALISFSSIIATEVPSVIAENFGPNVRVDDTGVDPSDQNSPSISVSEDGTIYVVWTDERNSSLYEDIYGATSVDGGTTFGSSVKINDNSGLSRRYGLDMATDSRGTAHVIWMDWRNDADGGSNWPGGGIDGKDNSDIYYSNTTDKGGTWSRNLVVSNSSLDDMDVSGEMAIDGNDTIHIVWTSWSNVSGLPFVLYSRSTDYGISFSEPMKIDNSSGTAMATSIAVDENDVIYVVWYDDRNFLTTGLDVWFTKSIDNGLNFVGHKRVNNDTAAVNQEHPKVSAQGGLIGIVWYSSPFDMNISFASSIDDGDTFSDAITVNDDFSPAARIMPTIWINESQHIVVSWDTRRNENWDVYLANSTDGGLSFSANQRVNDDVGATHQASVDLTMDTNGYVYVVWSDLRNGNADIYFTKAPPEISDLEPIDLSFNPPSPVTEWTAVNLNATIRNNGDRDATDVTVRFFNGDPSLNVQIGPDQSMPRIVANGGIGYAEAQWIVSPGGLHTIYVVVDPENDVTESNETNNVATANINVISLRPPTITQAILSGKDLKNVTVNWSLSPDDGMGSMTVTGDNVYRIMTYDSDGLGYSQIASLPNSTSTFTDIGAGDGNPNNYFYRVCARDVNNTTACSRTQAGKFTRPLVRGPNLASIPLIQSDESVEKVLQTVELDKAWVYDSSSEKWKWFMTFKPYKGELKTINETQGFWVTNDCNFTVAGIVPIQTAIHLSKGWNLVGFPSFQQDYSVANLEADVIAERAEGFNVLASPYFLRLMLDGDILQPGDGYWVEVVDETIWTVASS